MCGCGPLRRARGVCHSCGADPFGERFERFWQKEGIDTSHVVRDPEAPTGLYFIARKYGRHGFTYYRRGSAASRMEPGFLRPDYIRGARLLHVTGISQAIGQGPRDTVAAAMDTARAAGVLVSYDPNLRPALWPLEPARGVIHKTAALASVIFPSMEDAQLLTGLDSPEAIVRFYLDLGPGLVVLKLGAEGVLAGCGDPAAPEFTRVAAFKVDAVDASGAGDAFCGAFLAEWLRGSALPECLRYGCGVAALTTTALGCAGAIPDQATLEQFFSTYL